MSAVVVNLFTVPPASPVPGLATGGGTSGAGSPSSSPSTAAPTTPTGSTPAPVVPPIGGPQTVTDFPDRPDQGNQVIKGAVLYQFVGATQYAGIPGFWEPVVSPAPSLQGTHADRASFSAAAYPAGTQFFETDRQVVYQTDGTNWLYWSGAMSGVLAALPTDLGTNDVGFVYQALDFKHLYNWTGSGWIFAPTDAGSGQLIVDHPGFFISDGFYGLCDGSTYSVAQSDGTTANVTTAVLSPPTYIRR